MLIPHPARVLRRRGIGRIRRRARPTVKEIAADSRFLQAAKIGIGMFSRAKIMRPIRNCRDTGIKRLQRAPESTSVNVFRLVTRGNAIEHGGTVTRTGHLRRESADSPLPYVAVCIDEPWNHKTPFAVDHFRVPA